MTEQEQRAILTIALMAAYADGNKDDRESTQIRQICENLAPGTTIDLSGLYQDVLLKRRTTEDVVKDFNSPEARQLAYEMAVCVCDADGSRNAAETAFLEQLRIALALDAATSHAFAQESAGIAAAPLGPAVEEGKGGQAASAPPAANTVELEKMILHHSILNGALELLPQSLASMAILPLQMKMVYRIGKAYGYELDRGHIMDFAATLGIGLTGQYVEQMGRKLFGGLLRTVGGRMLGGLGSTATGAAFSFATTYALGMVAIQYYAGGRTLDMNKVKEAFGSLLARGRDLQTRYAGEIQAKARTIDVNQLVNVVRE
jgi:uncharacterized protein (DUF697 family)/tellurite resistance protein